MQALPHRPLRGRDRVRRRGEPLHLRALRARREARRARGVRRAGRRGHLDHDPLDAAGRRGRDRSSPTPPTSPSPTTAAPRSWRATAWRPSAPTAGWDPTLVEGFEASRRGARRPCATATRSSRRRRAASSAPTSSRWTTAPASSTPRPATASTTTTPAAASACPSPCPSTTTGASTPARAWVTGGPFSGMDTDEANPEIIAWLQERGTLVARRDINHSYPHCWRCKRPDDLPRHRPVVRLDGRDGPARRRRSTPSRTTSPGIPPTRASASARWSSGRPDWCISPPAQLGRANPELHVRRLRREGHERRHARRASSPCSGRRAPTPGSPTRPQSYLGEACVCPKCGGQQPQGRLTTSSTCGGTRASPGRPCASIRPELELSRPTCTSRAPTSTAAGSRARCSRHRWVPTATPRTSAVVSPGLHARRPGPQDVQVARQRHRPQQGL